MKTQKLVYMAIFIALGVVLPMAFHFVGGPGLGTVFLPMHIPVLMGGAFLGPFAGAIVGLITPIISSFLTGMPPVLPMLPIMIVELAVYGMLMGYLYQERSLNVYLSLFISMLAGRAGAGLIVLILVHGMGFAGLPANPLVYIWGAITSGIPGILIQFVFIPPVVYYLHNFWAKKAQIGSNF